MEMVIVYLFVLLIVTFMPRMLKKCMVVSLDLDHYYKQMTSSQISNIITHGTKHYVIEFINKM
jgi:hypothetical protein